MLYEHITKDMTHKKFVKEVRTDLPTCRLAACCLLLAPCFLWLAICCSLLAACDLLLAPSNQLDSPAPPCANKLLPLLPPPLRQPSPLLHPSRCLKHAVPTPEVELRNGAQLPHSSLRRQQHCHD